MNNKLRKQFKNVHENKNEPNDDNDQDKPEFVPDHLVNNYVNMKVIDVPGYDPNMPELDNSESECDVNDLGKLEDDPDQDEIEIDSDDDDLEKFKSVTRTNALLPLEYDVAEDGEILATEKEVEIEVAQDSGAVDHVAGPGDIPQGVVIDPNDPNKKNFINASGDKMKNLGCAHVGLIDENGNYMSNVFQVTDVCRPLHSTSKICDTGKEVLFTKDGAIVVPAGSLSKYLKHCKQLARYGRRGGLYVTKLKVVPPKSPKPDSKSSFGGPGVKP